MSSTKDILLNIVCPAFGCILGVTMFSAPIKSIKSALDKANGLGPLNPTPFAAMLGNTIGWVAYGFIQNDLWITIPNGIGMFISIWLNLSTVKLMYQSKASAQIRSSMVSILGNNHEMSKSLKSSMTNVRNDIESIGSDDNQADSDSKKDHHNNLVTSIWSQTLDVLTLENWQTPHDNLIMFFCVFWATLITIVYFAPLSALQQQLIVGIIVNINLIFFYGAPLTTIITVCKTRNSIRLVLLVLCVHFVFIHIIFITYSSFFI